MILRLPEITKIAYLIFKNSTNKIALIGSGISLSLVMIDLKTEFRNRISRIPNKNIL